MANKKKIYMNGLTAEENIVLLSVTFMFTVLVTVAIFGFYYEARQLTRDWRYCHDEGGKVGWSDGKCNLNGEKYYINRLETPRELILND